MVYFGWDHDEPYRKQHVLVASNSFIRLDLCNGLRREVVGMIRYAFRTSAVRLFILISHTIKYNFSSSLRWLHVINAPPCYLTSAYNNMEPALMLLFERTCSERFSFALTYRQAM